MALHFAPDEFARRQEAARRAMAARGLDGLLLFKQESMYYLTGYDSFGFVFFQCLHVGADGRMTLLTRSPDLRQAQQTSTLTDIRIWVDAEDADPQASLRAILEERGCRGHRLGVEWDSYGLTARNGQRLAEALDGFALLEDASDLVSRLRLVKSPAEIVYVRRAAVLADGALEEAVRLARPGAEEGAILAAMQGAVLAGGGDYSGNPFILGSGPGALLCRSYSGRRRLDARDQLTLEFAGAWRHYHACLMRTIRIGRREPAEQAMYAAAHDALLACEDALRPGRLLGEVFDAHASVLDRAGMGAHRLNACGYSLGALFQPNWMDWPMLYRANPVAVEPGMVFFLHMILMNSDQGIAVTLGRTSLIGPTGAEPLSRASLDPIVV